MCGRYNVDTEAEGIQIKMLIDEINHQYGYSEDAAKMRLGEIFPTNIAPVIVESGAVPMRWGYPKWDGKGVIINARSETAHEKSMFRLSLLERRCVIPTTGFYEWRHEGAKSKEKYLFQWPDSPLLYLAGIYNEFAEPDDGKQRRFVILTVAANESMAPYHDRMPVLIRADERKAWIDGSRMSEILCRVQGRLVARATETRAEQGRLF